MDIPTVFRAAPSNCSAFFPQVFPLDQAPRELQAIARTFAEKYGESFDSVYLFPDEQLSRLHAAEPRPEELARGSGTVVIASALDPCIPAAIYTLTRLANGDAPTLRHQYLQTVCDLYRRLPGEPELLANDPATLCIAPEREGRIIAEALGWLHPGLHVIPEAKRMRYSAGLAVALGMTAIPDNLSACMIVDGAIASGATIMSICQRVSQRFHRIYVYSIHATPSSLRALSRFAAVLGIDLTLIVAHASGVLNGKYYAVEPEDPAQLIVGDMGDLVTETAPAD